MKNKHEILEDIQQALSAGIITDDDLRPFIHTPQAQALPAVPAPKPASKPEKLSAVDMMFYIAGIVLYSAILSMIVQSWEGGNAIVHIFLSLGIGAVLWSIAYYLIKRSVQSDVRNGLTNALLLTGSLLIITGGYIVTNELVDGFDKINLIPIAFTMIVLGAVHIGFDRLVKRDWTLLMGILLCVAAFPTILIGFLQETDVPLDVWSVIFIVTAGLLAYATRVVARINPDRPKIHDAFDSFAVFLGLASMYVASFGDFSLLWQAVLIAAVFGIFYLSIVTQSKQLLGNASFFLVVSVITIAFKYFSGFGVTTSLVIATLGLLGTAAIASNINKRYFKAT